MAISMEQLLDGGLSGWGTVFKIDISSTGAEEAKSLWLQREHLQIDEFRSALLASYIQSYNFDSYWNTIDHNEASYRSQYSY